MRLIAFLYILLRDYLTAAQVEAIIRDHVRADGFAFSNKHTERMARAFAERLGGK